MAEREKFDDDGSAKGKIATSPDITIDVPDAQKRKNKPVRQQADNPLQRDAERVEPLKDDPESDARYSRMLGRMAQRMGLGADFAQEAQEWGGDLFPLLREALRNKPTVFRVAVGAVLGAPAVIGGVRLALKMLKKEEKQNVPANS